MIIFAMSDKTDSLNFIWLDVLMLILMAKVRIFMICFRQDWDAHLCGLGSLPPGEDFRTIFAILCKFLGFGKETWARLSFMFELVSGKAELITILEGGRQGPRSVSVILFLASDTVFVQLNQYSQILRRQCCLHWPRQYEGGQAQTEKTCPPRASSPPPC